MTHYVRLLTEGKTWTQICTFMNANQWWDQGNRVLGGLDGRLDADPKADIYSWGVTYYVRMLIEGKNWTAIVTFFNQNQYFKFPNTSPDNLNNYKFKTF
jgi:hypothetical protein